MEIINFQGRYINILGSVENPYFIGSEIGRILGFVQPHVMGVVLAVVAGGRHVGS